LGGVVGDPLDDLDGVLRQGRLGRGALQPLGEQLAQLDVQPRQCALVGLVQDGDRAFACLAPCAHQSFARPRYSPVRVSTLTFVPVSRKSGTWISYPVSTVAGFVPAEERSPCRPGSV